MSFGPPIAVERHVPLPNQTNEVRLAPFGMHQAEAIFPIPADDPMLPLLPPSVRADRTAPYNPYTHNLPYGRYAAPDKLSWGVYANEQLIGAAAIQRGTGCLSLDIHIARAHRDMGVDELVLAALTRATFTKDYVHSTNPAITNYRRPIAARIWAHREDKALKNLAGRFGFTFASSQQVEPGCRMTGYELMGGLVQGGKVDKQTKGTMKAAKKLAEFRVQSQGRIKIPEQPIEMFERFTTQMLYGAS